MKYFVKGKSSIELNQSNFVADGGEGNFYVKNNMGYKIYHDPNKCISEAKIIELAKITNMNVIKPEDLLLDQHSVPNGYSMRYVSDTYALSQLFPKAFRNRNGFTPDKTLKLVEDLQRGVAELHKQGILIVDVNENNFLVSKDFKESYFIDTDSYQTISFPAKALSELVRDRHGKSGEFTEGTDWFSFAIISFWLFRGIHPYRGNHPDYHDLDSRMTNNISILHNRVTYPKAAVLDENVVPPIWNNWFVKILEKGERLAPPNTMGAIMVIAQPKISHMTGTLFEYIELFYFTYSKIDEEVLSLHRSGNHMVAVTKSKIYLDKGRSFDYTGVVTVGFLPKLDTPYSVNLISGKLLVRNLITGDIIPCNLNAESIMEYEGQVFYKNGSNLMVLDPILLGQNILLAGKLICNVLPNASVLWQGCLIQNMLGSFFVTIPNGNQIGLKELSGYKIIEAKYENGVLMIVGSKGTIYDRFVYKIDGTNTSYRKVTNINYSGLNFVVLANGICVTHTESDEVEIFSNNPSKTDLKVLTNSPLSDTILLKDGVAVIIQKLNERKFYQLKMR